jgi:hypothetical protein
MEPWDNSTEKAKELKLSDFGTSEEVQEMAKMGRTAKDREEVRKILKTIVKNGNLRSKSGLVVTLSGKSIEKIISEQALHRSFKKEAHWLAAANIDTLFINAIEPWEFELNPNKINENLKERKYLYAPMGFVNRIILVKFTVKEYQQKGTEKRLYSIEAMNVELKE